MTVFEKQTSRFFKFKNIGDTIVGILTEVGEPRQATKFNPNPNAPRQLDFWESSDGGAPRPKMEVLLTLQTELREDPDDDGKRKVVIPVFYKDGSQLSAIQAAMFPTGAADLEIGAKIGLRFTGHDPQSANPDNPRKLYVGMYERPAAAGGAFQQQQAAAPQQQQQPAPQQQAWQAPAPQQQPAWQQPSTPPAPYQAPQQQPAWQQQPAAEPQWQQPAAEPQWDNFQPPAEAYQLPSQPTPQQAQAAAAFSGTAGQQQQWQQPQPAAQQQQPAAPAAPSSYQVDVAMGLIAKGAPDNYISEQSGLSMEAVSALRNR